MKISKKNHAVIMGVQCAFAALNAFFIFYQTKLIDSLKENYLQYSLLLVTVLFFVGNVVANLCENYVREREFYSLSVRTKAKAAKNYFMQPVHDDCGEPVINYSVTYDSNNSVPLYHEDFMTIFIQPPYFLHCLLLFLIFLLTIISTREKHKLAKIDMAQYCQSVALNPTNNNAKSKIIKAKFIVVFF